MDFLQHQFGVSPSQERNGWSNCMCWCRNLRINDLASWGCQKLSHKPCIYIGVGETAGLHVDRLFNIKVTFQNSYQNLEVLSLGGFSHPLENLCASQSGMNTKTTTSLKPPNYIIDVSSQPSQKIYAHPLYFLLFSVSLPRTPRGGWKTNVDAKHPSRNRRNGERHR